MSLMFEIASTAPEASTLYKSLPDYAERSATTVQIIDVPLRHIEERKKQKVVKNNNYEVAFPCFSPTPKRTSSSRHRTTPISPTSRRSRRSALDGRSARHNAPDPTRKSYGDYQRPRKDKAVIWKYAPLPMPVVPRAYDEGGECEVAEYSFELEQYSLPSIIPPSDLLPEHEEISEIIIEEAASEERTCEEAEVCATVVKEVAQAEVKVAAPPAGGLHYPSLDSQANTAFISIFIQSPTFGDIAAISDAQDAAESIELLAVPESELEKRQRIAKEIRAVQLEVEKARASYPCLWEIDEMRPALVPPAEEFEDDPSSPFEDGVADVIVESPIQRIKRRVEAEIQSKMIGEVPSDDISAPSPEESLQCLIEESHTASIKPAPIPVISETTASAEEDPVPAAAHAEDAIEETPLQRAYRRTRETRAARLNAQKELASILPSSVSQPSSVSDPEKKDEGEGEEDESLAVRLVRLRKAAAERHAAYERFKADNGLGSPILALPAVPEVVAVIEKDVERAPVEVEQVEVPTKAVEVEAAEETEIQMTAGDVGVFAGEIEMEADAAEDAADIVVEAEMVEVETTAEIQTEPETVPQKRKSSLRKIAKVIGKQIRKLKLKVDFARLGAALKRI
ncbi:hypothetical protein BOTBODRAFT_190193 [Botryobasidium botryosum FD-172 SS1]|uniref:Uncharacterized protein n=1 Tax=Botryobasidium botryosum (strain FD-172 SS1) TaxID=930990 RepID=A0A067M540_BOTB1|nr:hypothetical protein BOTBODRAFT_190193 [Botryobasidium botryosum FD-172 SS1]